MKIIRAVQCLLLCFVPFAVLRADEPRLPPEAVLLSVEKEAALSKPKTEGSGIVSVESDGAPVNPVWRATSAEKLAKPYELALNKKFSGAVAQDQICLFLMKARCVESDAADGRATLTAAVQNTKNYSAGALWKDVFIGREWVTHYFAFTANNEIPEGAGLLKVVLGNRRQVVEVADFQLYRFPAGFDIYSVPRMAATYEGREANAAWRVDAEERIAKVRRGTLGIRVVDAEDRPLPGAKVHVEMTRHAFGFGSAVDVEMLSGLDRKISASDQIKYRNTVDEFFSRIVPENGLRLGNIDAPPDPAKPWTEEDRRRMKAAVLWTLQWAADRRMTSRGHYLVWGYAEQWAKDILKTGTPADLLATYDRHFAFAIPLVKDYVAEWDALNHPVPFAEADALTNIVGPDIYSDLYKKIRPLTPLPLFVNEDTFNAERTDGFEKAVREMIARGATPDGCGFQSHYHDYEVPAVEDVWKMWNRFAPLARQLAVTEYDFQTLDDQLHADHLRDMLTLAFSHPQMTGFVIWGFWEKRHWKPMASMFKADWTERPAVKVWRDFVKGKWWTRADLISDAKGEAATSAFFGWHDVTVEHNGRATTRSIYFPAGGKSVTIKLE